MVTMLFNWSVWWVLDLEADMDGKVDLWEMMAYVLGRKSLACRSSLTTQDEMSKKTLFGVLSTGGSLDFFCQLNLSSIKLAVPLKTCTSLRKPRKQPVRISAFSSTSLRSIFLKINRNLWYWTAQDESSSSSVLSSFQCDVCAVYHLD